MTGTRENQYRPPEEMSRIDLIIRVRELEQIVLIESAPPGSYTATREGIVDIARRALRVMAVIPIEEFNDGDALVHDLAHGVLMLAGEPQ